MHLKTSVKWRPFYPEEDELKFKLLLEFNQGYQRNLLNLVTLQVARSDTIFIETRTPNLLQHPSVPCVINNP